MESVLTQGDIVADKLRVIRKLGEGGMGAVYEVEHLFTKHRRALKMLHGPSASNPQAVERFLREASAAGRIGNQHIVECFDAGRLPGGEPYLVMELLEGESLADRLERKGRLAVEEAVEILLQAARGVHAAHEAGIVHRDLKPENLFLLRGLDVTVKILDFGISKFDKERFGTRDVTQEGALLGTPYYMAPEQVRGEAADVGADVYALGVVLYECLTGQKPFVAETLPELSVKIFVGDYTPPDVLREELSPALCDLIAAAMAKERSGRPRGALAFAAALENLGSANSMARTMAASKPPIASTVLLDETPLSEVAPARTQRSVPDVEEGAGLRAPLTQRSPDPAMATIDGLSRNGVQPPAVAAPPTRTKRLLVVGGAATVIGVVGTWLALRSPASPSVAGAAAAEPKPGVALPPVAASAVLDVSPSGSALPPSTPPPSASAPESTAAPSTKPQPAAAPGPSIGKPTAKPTPTTRANEHGVASENPF
ncbi:MAG: protein kinase [Polyangiaceae bacterium]